MSEASMGFGSTAKKLQQLSDLAEDLIGRLNDLKERVTRMEESVDEAESRLQRIDDELTEQRALLEAVASANDIDPATVTANLDTGHDNESSQGSQGSTDNSSESNTDADA